MTQTSTACKNCGATLTGNFCQNCGQKADIHRITFGHLLHEFFHVLTHADKGILFLIKELSYRPGHVAKDYLNGQRKKYFNPLSFLVITSAIFALVALKSGYFEAQEGMGSRNYGEVNSRYAFYMKQSTEIFVENGKLISIIVVVPLLTFLTWLYFGRPRYNFAEHLVIQSLIVGVVNVSMIVIFIPAFLLFGYPTINNIIFQVTFLVYQVIAYQQFFKDNVYVTIVKTIVIQILFIVFYWILIFGFVFVREQLFH